MLKPQVKKIDQILYYGTFQQRHGNHKKNIKRKCRNKDCGKRDEEHFDQLISRPKIAERRISEVEKFSTLIT